METARLLREAESLALDTREEIQSIDDAAARNLNDRRAITQEMARVNEERVR